MRLSYTKDPTTNVLTILEENNYYPYGLKHENYNADVNAFIPLGTAVKITTVPVGVSTAVATNAYKYNGKEMQNELALNLYDMDLRDYDPATGVWTGVDPVTHFSQSPYNAFDGNPVLISDPSGADGYGNHSISSSNSPFAGGNAAVSNTGAWSGGGAFGVYDPKNQSLANWGDGIIAANHYGGGLNIFLDWQSLQLNTNINFTKNGIHVSSDDYIPTPQELPGILLLFKGGHFSDNAGELIQGHVYANGTYYQHYRDVQNYKSVGNFAQGMQDVGDITAGIGYALTATGVLAEVGAPLARVGGYVSKAGAIVSIGNNLYYQGITSGKAWKTLGFFVLGEVAEHYVGKIPGFDGIGEEIMKQNVGLKIMAIDRYTDYLMEKKE